MRSRVFISIGSNLGERLDNCQRAVATLTAPGAGVGLVRVSPYYETEPWGRPDQGPFVNVVVEVETALAPQELLKRTREVEAALGRTRGERWGPRVIDLDIVFYGDYVMDEPGLVIPHPHAHERAFVLAPISDIAPEFVHPVLDKSVSELLRSLEDKGAVRRLVPGAP